MGKQSWMAFGKDGWICQEHAPDFFSHLFSAFDWKTMANDLLVALTITGENDTVQVAISVFT